MHPPAPKDGPRRGRNGRRGDLKGPCDTFHRQRHGSPPGRVSELRAPMGPPRPPLGVARSLILVLSRGSRCFAPDAVVSLFGQLRALTAGIGNKSAWVEETRTAIPPPLKEGQLHWQGPAGRRKPALGRRFRVDSRTAFCRRVAVLRGFAPSVACRRGGWLGGRVGFPQAASAPFRSAGAVGRSARASAERDSGASRLLLTSLALRSAADWTARGSADRFWGFVGKSNSPSSGALPGAVGLWGGWVC
jgi:hypothetical protein